MQRILNNDHISHCCREEVLLVAVRGAAGGKNVQDCLNGAEDGLWGPTAIG